VSCRHALQMPRPRVRSDPIADDTADLKELLSRLQKLAHCQVDRHRCLIIFPIVGGFQVETDGGDVPQI